MQTQTEQTLTEALAEIGVTHRKSAHYGYRELIAADGEIIDARDVRTGWDFVRQAQAAG